MRAAHTDAKEWSTFNLDVFEKSSPWYCSNFPSTKNLMNNIKLKTNFLKIVYMMCNSNVIFSFSFHVFHVVLFVCSVVVCVFFFSSCCVYMYNLFFIFLVSTAPPDISTGKLKFS